MDHIRLLFVDDEEDFRTPITAILQREGMEVREAGSARQMDETLAHYAPDVIVLDLNLPDESGLDIASRLKREGNYTIVMLTAYGSVEDRIKGLTHGADYYLPKPVDSRELIAIVRNLAQREKGAATATAAWLLDPLKWTLTTPDQVCHELTKAELQILAALAEQQGKAVKRQQLYAALGFPDYAPESRGLDIQVSRLRRRFTTAAYKIPIKTVHSIGYLFNAPIEVIGGAGS